MTLSRFRLVLLGYLLLFGLLLFALSRSPAVSITQSPEFREFVWRRASRLRIFTAMHLLFLTIGCFGGGTGLPSLLGGLKRNPWLRLNAVVTMFDIQDMAHAEIAKILGIPEATVRSRLFYAHRQLQNYLEEFRKK